MDGTDLLVDARVQQALNYSNIDSRILIDDNYEYLDHHEWYDILYGMTVASWPEKISNALYGIVETMITVDPLYPFFAILMSVVPYTWDMGKYDLIHTKELGNKNVCKAVLSAINKSNKNIGGY